MVEAVREGYLLHYGEPRLLAGHDPDLALLAGDYLYALGIERLAALGDTEAVRVLADLISTCAQLHTEGREDEVPGLWRESRSQAIAGLQPTPLLTVQSRISVVVTLLAAGEAEARPGEGIDGAREAVRGRRSRR